MIDVEASLFWGPQSHCVHTLLQTALQPVKEASVLIVMFGTLGRTSLPFHRCNWKLHQVNSTTQGGLGVTRGRLSELQDLQLLEAPVP